MVARKVDMGLNKQQQGICETSRWDFSDLTALFLNCTLKRSPESRVPIGKNDPGP